MRRTPGDRGDRGRQLPGAAAGMAGVDPTITIPSVRVTQADGNTFKANLGAGLNATLKRASDINRDSDIDNGVIAHEYMHGISNRLTGGPSKTSGCLVTATDLEHMGEGWSDYLALVLTAKTGDTDTKARGIGNYVAFQGTNGIGIRPTQYTTDTAVNPSTYDTIKNPMITQPHGVGYVWATMLWEVYWNLVAKHGFNADVYGDWHTGGNNLAIQLVFDGLKLQPCHPGFVDGRNAILRADLLVTGGANQCEIWNGFAKRGLGVSASQGLSTSRTDGTLSTCRPPARWPASSAARRTTRR
jgi:extracellular elastinolytic metalloproteinase